MSSLQHWSGKSINYVDGDSTWVRADYAERMRAALVGAGRIETGKTLVTGGKTYHEFLMAA